MLKSELQNGTPNHTALENVELDKTVKNRKRRRKKNVDEANLSKEELQKLRREEDAQRKKRRRLEMTLEEREEFRKKENERKKLERLKVSYNAQRAKENERKKQKRRTMTEEERQAFLKKDAERKRLERKRRREAALALKNNTQIPSMQKSDPVKIKSDPAVVKQIKIEYSEDMIKNIKTSHATPVKEKKLTKLRKGSGRRCKLDSEDKTESKSKDIVKMEISTMMQEMMSLDYVSISAEETEKDILDEKALIVPLSYAMDNARDTDILNKESLVLPVQDTGDHVFSGLFDTHERDSPSLFSACEEETIILPSTEEKDPPVVLELIDSMVLFDDMDCLKYDMLGDSSSAECKSGISFTEQHVQSDENQDENLILEFLSNQHEEEIFNSFDGNVSVILPDEEEIKVMPEMLSENFIITILHDENEDTEHSTLAENLSSSIILNTKEDEIDTMLGKKVTLHMTSEEKFEPVEIISDEKDEELVDQVSDINSSNTVVQHLNEDNCKKNLKLPETVNVNEIVDLTNTNQQKINIDEKICIPLNVENVEHSIECIKKPSVTQDELQFKEKITTMENLEAESKQICIKDDDDDESVNSYIFGQSGSKTLHSISQVDNETDDLCSNQDLSRRENGWHWAYTALWRKQQRPDYFNVTDLLSNCPIITHETKGNCRSYRELQSDVLLAEEYQLQRRYSEPSFEIGNERYVFNGLQNSQQLTLFKENFNRKLKDDVSENSFLLPALQNKLCIEEDLATATEICNSSTETQNAARLQNKKIPAIKMLNTNYSSDKTALTNQFQKTKCKFLQEKCSNHLGVRSASMHSEYCNTITKSNFFDIDAFDKMIGLEAEIAETPSSSHKSATTDRLAIVEAVAKNVDVMETQMESTTCVSKITNGKERQEFGKEHRSGNTFKSIFKNNYKSDHLHNSRSQALICFQKPSEKKTKAGSLSTITPDFKNLKSKVTEIFFI